MKPIRFSLLLLLLSAQAGISMAAEVQVQRPVDLYKTVQSQEQRLGRLESQLQSQGLLNLLNQVEALKAEVARLRGSQEELAYQQEIADKRVKDLLADMDDRVKELESRPVVSPFAPGAVRLQPAQALSAASPAPSPAATPSPAPSTAVASVPVTPAPATPMDSSAETKAYEGAHQLVKAGRYKEAVLAFQAFAKTYPNSSLVPNAHYWTGFSYVGMSDFDSAAVSYQYLIDTFPNSSKTPDAMLSLARAQVQMNKQAEAATTLDSLLERFPYSRAADNGKKLLSTLR